MQCVKCNTNNRNSAKFCKQCGTAITESKPSASLGLSIDQLVGFDEINYRRAELCGMFVLAS